MSAVEAAIEKKSNGDSDLGTAEHLTLQDFVSLIRHLPGYEDSIYDERRGVLCPREGATSELAINSLHEKVQDIPKKDVLRCLERLASEMHHDLSKHPPLMFMASPSRFFTRRKEHAFHRQLLPGVSLGLTMLSDSPTNGQPSRELVTPASLTDLCLDSDKAFEIAYDNLQDATPKTLRLTNGENKGEGDVLTVKLLAESQPAVKIFCTDNQAVARMCLAKFVHSLSLFLRCKPTDLVILPAMQDVLIAGIACNPHSMLSIADALLTLEVTPDVLQLTPYMVKRLPSNGSRSWVLWTEYPAYGTDHGFVGEDGSQQFTIPITKEDVGKMRIALAKKKSLPMIQTRTKRGGPIKAPTKNSSGAAVEQTQKTRSHTRPDWKQQLKDVKLWLAVLGIIAIFVAQVMSTIFL